MSKIIKIGTPTCGPCKVAENLLNKYNVKHVSYDAVDAEDICTQYRVGSVPTILKLDDDGKEISRLVGGDCLQAHKIQEL